MPITKGREYRTMPLMSAAKERKRLDCEYYVEGYAAIFDAPYLLFEDGDGTKYYEVIDRKALVNADLTDVIMQCDHSGHVFARTKMAQNKPHTLIVEPNEHGIFVAANLGLTDAALRMYDEIEKGLIYQMSWAFTVAEDEYNRDTHTRTILRIKKIYDVSAVSIPANPDTDISARDYISGVTDMIKRETLEAEKRKKLILLLTINGGK